jgi:putative transposase
MLACAFVTVDGAVTMRRVDVFVVPEASTRQVHVRGVTPCPDRSWTRQQARHLLTDMGERATRFRFLARDRAGQCTDACDPVLSAAGAEVVTIPPRSPRANTCA